MRNLIALILMLCLLGCTQDQLAQLHDNMAQMGSDVRVQFSQMFSRIHKDDASDFVSSSLQTRSFGSLKQWNTDLHSAALRGFLESCKKIQSLPPQTPMSPANVGGIAGDWQPLCVKASQLDDGDDFTATRFFEDNFTPYAVSSRNGTLFTGYYEISLRGSKKRRGPYQYPIYSSPSNLTTIYPGQHGLAPTDPPASGMLVHGELRPFYTRAQINAGALKNKKLEIVWVDDPVRLFFLHVQGVGTVYLDDGDHMRVGFAAKNGHPYTSIGKILVERGELSSEEVTAPAIMQWLYTHPNQAQEVMNQNQSFIFFRKTISGGPIGAQGVAIAPERSVAIDPRNVPYGAPVWIETALPIHNQMKPYNRLMIAQDTGSAIKGPDRADIFFGSGQEAETIAGNMKSRGNMFVLLPKAVNP